MPLPLILIGVSAVAGITGIASGINGMNKISDANKIKDDAEKLYYTKKIYLR
ncbi:hypothetical protein ROR02_12250 [Pararhodospirillum oryzae]|uniref:Uncharacterized protein n=1 Tax=Pararhodospirillum oryzae TaxID=478448 RepID=A0A512H6M2_9PROT|nr:hypothetical protein ROR02_12250 [Pararhodospirillum oryzae]